MARLGVRQLEGVLLHRASDLLGEQGGKVYRALTVVKARGFVRKIGASGYGPSELTAITEKHALDLVQLPLNVFDRRAINSGLLVLLASRQVEIHVRSVFLQGLLTLPKERRPRYFTRWAPLFAHWHDWLCETGLTPLEAALRFVLAVPEVSRIVLGFDAVNQLSEVLEAAEGPLPNVPSEMQSDDEALINPSFWVPS
jgi:aryl-alcohol dehydrogenase-like predicted oxidoreductase